MTYYPRILINSEVPDIRWPIPMEDSSSTKTPEVPGMLTIEHLREISQFNDNGLFQEGDLVVVQGYVNDYFEQQRLKYKYKDIDFKQPQSNRNCPRLNITRYVTGVYS